MFESFLNFIKENQLFESNQKVLLAVSGGIDSMVLLYLFEKSGFEYGIIHCNFNLRGIESDGDEEFVRNQVLIHGVPAFFENFETEEYAQLNGISIEMAARELRYEYFEKIRSEHHYDFIATAHHLDDLIETFFLNLSRKTGIKGLTGIKEKAGNIIRPLLFADRNEIEDFARFNFIEFREDSSNSEVVYQRNFLRHKILPLFSVLNPSFKKNLLASIENLKDAEQVYSGFLQTEKEKILVNNNSETELQIESLLKVPYPKMLLFEILADFNFNAAVISEIYESLNSDSGKQFYSKTHRVVKDREYLFIIPVVKREKKIYYIEKGDIELFEPMDLNLEKLNAEGFNIIKEPNVACLDFEKLEFPLLIRKWRQGDYFQPLGMNGLKKVSDFFIDEKIPIHEKENIWLLCSGKKIVWIMGHRIDNRFKFSPETKSIFKIEIKKP
jgi:tRNA(Ile)-lysidine synthase